MSDTTLVADPRTPVGSRPTRRLRSGGRIPAVVYGDGVGPLAVSVEARELRHALSTPAGLNAVLSVHVGSEEYTAMAREIQRHPVRGTVTHVDFQVVDPDRPVSADVTVVAHGRSRSSSTTKTAFSSSSSSPISVRAKPSEIPQHFEVDVSGLVVGTAVRVSDLVIPRGSGGRPRPGDGHRGRATSTRRAYRRRRGRRRRRRGGRSARSGRWGNFRGIRFRGVVGPAARALAGTPGPVRTSGEVVARGGPARGRPR